MPTSFLFLEPDSRSEPRECEEDEESVMLSGWGELSLELGGVAELLCCAEPLLSELDFLFLGKNSRPDKLFPARGFLELDTPLAISSASASDRERELFSACVPVELCVETRGEWRFLTLTFGRSLRLKLR